MLVYLLEGEIFSVMWKYSSVWLVTFQLPASTHTKRQHFGGEPLHTIGSLGSVDEKMTASKPGNGVFHRVNVYLFRVVKVTTPRNNETEW